MGEDNRPWHEKNPFEIIRDGYKKIKDKVSGSGITSIGDDSPEDIARKKAEAAFQQTGRDNFGALGLEAAKQRQALQNRVNGQGMLSPEMLRQGLQQNLAAQRSMAAGASPQNQGMAARTAAIQSGRLGAGMSGQAALAGLQEQKQAQDSLSGMITSGRDQELGAAHGAKVDKDKTFLDKNGPALVALLGMLSDRNAKTEIKDGAPVADHILDGLRARSYRYKDPSNGKGRQLGIMAQDLERVGLKQAVVDTPQGKMVDGAKLAGANTAMLAALSDRLRKVEDDRKGPRFSADALRSALARR